MKQLLKFADITEIGKKTKTIKVYSAHSDDFLGIIHWKPGWRCYVMTLFSFSYNDNVDMSIGCNEELNDFMKKLEDERKQRLKEEKDVQQM